MFKKNTFINIIFLVSCYAFVNCGEKSHGQKYKWMSDEISEVFQKALSSLPNDKIPNEFKLNLNGRDKLF